MAEVRRILDAFQGHALNAIVALAIGGGLRRGEGLGLKWSDVDLDGAKARIERQLVRYRGSGVFAPPKTDRSRRTVALPAWCVAILRERRRRQIEAQMRAGTKWADQDLVFANGSGGPANPAEVSYEFTKGLRRAGLPHVRFHDLRHGFASLLLSDGEDLGVISDLMGHSTIAITKDLYAEASREAQAPRWLASTRSWVRSSYSKAPVRFSWTMRRSGSTSPAGGASGTFSHFPFRFAQ